MAWERDPVSEDYDSPARQLVSEAIRRARRNQPPWVTAHVPSPPGDVRLDAGGLTRHERALTRALYHDPRVYFHSPAREWALKVEWDGRGARGKRLRLRVFRHGIPRGPRYTAGEGFKSEAGHRIDQD
jgi:hypothetical protein